MRIARTAALLAGLAFATLAGAQMPDFTRLVREQGRVVVDIVRSLPAPAPDEPPDESLFEGMGRLFGDPSPPAGRALGAGFIIGADGVILTNAHIVSGARKQEVRVRLQDRREFDARVLGSDLHSDIALLKIDASGLPVARIGDPQALEPGEWVAAIGSPFGLERSVTAGIVSAKDRSLPEISTVLFLQTDVAVNPGNSGGPLFNLKGEVVGVNSMIYTDSGGYTGLSFAVPIDLAMDVATQLREHGRVLRGRLGLRLQTPTPEIAAALRLPRATGALVTDVEEDGPAARAGIRTADLIVSFAGKPVESPADLIRFATGSRPGTAAEVTFHRGAKLSKARVVVGDASSSGNTALEVPAVTPDLARLGLRLGPANGGVLVLGAEGAAQRAGLRRGDLILALDGAEIADVQAFRRFAAARAGRTVALLVQRANGRAFVAMRLP